MASGVADDAVAGWTAEQGGSGQANNLTYAETVSASASTKVLVV